MSFDAEASRASMERIKRLEDVLAAVREKVAALEARVAILDKCVSRHVGIACDVAEREKVARLVALLGCAAELLDDEGCSEMADQLRRGALRETADDSGAAE